MQTRRQTIQRNKLISLVLLPILLLSMPGLGNLPLARAADGGTPTPPPDGQAAQNSQAGQSGQQPSHPPVVDAVPSLLQKQQMDQQSAALNVTAAAPSNDDFDFPTFISSTPFGDALDTSGATGALDDPYMGCGSGTNSNTVWYQFVAPADGKFHADTFGSNYDTVLAAFTGARGALNGLACNDDFSGGQSQIEFSLTSGETYFLEVADYGSPGGGQLQLTVNFVPLAKIEVPLDIVLLQDETGSMSDDIWQLQSLAPQIWDSIDRASTAGFQMSIVGFRDYSQSAWGDYGDWVYRRLSDLTTDRNQYIGAVNALTADGGGDDPEAQYAALDYLLTPGHACIDSDGNGICAAGFATPDTLAGLQPHFRSGAQRIVLLATDAGLHDPSNTFGYPGPMRDTVVSRLIATHTIVIGLVPGGAGRLLQVDDLTALTGGSTQDTGSSGQDVADAIAAALAQIQPVSPDLSTVGAAPASLPADGSSLSAVTVTLRDAANVPVEGHSVMLRSMRGGVDFIIQPAAPTDSNGQTVGYVASLSTGTSNIVAVDVTDSVQVTQPASIQFLSQAEDLLRQIDRLNSASQTQLANVASISQTAGATADELRRSIAGDKAQIAIEALLGFHDTYEGVQQIEKLQAGVQLALPGLEDAGHSVARNFVNGYPESAALFDFTWQQAIETGNIRNVIARPILMAGLKYFAAEFLHEGVEQLTQDGLVYAWQQMTASGHGFSDAGNGLAQDIGNLQLDLGLQRDALSVNLPPMSPAQQASYVDDLGKRVFVPYVWSSVLWQEARMLENVRDAHDSVGSNGFASFFLKFIAKFLATTSFDGPGKILVDGITNSFDLYLDARKLDLAQKAFDQAPSILQGSMNAAVQIYDNQATALERISRGLPSHLVTGQIEGLRHYTQGTSFLSFYSEDVSFSEIDLHNTSLTEPGTFEVLVQYGYNTRLFGLPWAYMPIVNSEVIQLQPGETQTVRVFYKEYERGGSPEPGSLVTFDVLAVNAAGAYHIDSKIDPWQPQVLTFAGKGLAASAVLSASTPVIENPITTYVTSNPADQTYQAEIYLSNPFNAPIDTHVTQMLPAGLIVLTTDGVKNGSIITWNKSIAAQDIASVSFTFRYPADPGALLSLPAATLQFSAPPNGESVSLTSNIPTFTGLSPVVVEGHAPLGQANVASTMPITVTNLVNASKTGSIRMVVSDATNSPLSDQTQPFNVGALGQQVLVFPLPGLAQGLYQVDVSFTIGGVSLKAFGDTYKVNPPPVTISGNTGTSGVLLSYTDGTQKTILSSPNGDYSFIVPSYWSGIVTPSKICYSLDPPSRNYGSLTAAQAAQDYTDLLNDGCASADIRIGNENKGTFGIPIQGSLRQSFPNVNNGPVNIDSTNSPLLMAERVIYKVNGVNASFSEMMALPDSQLDHTYWLPWYNNVDLDTQLRFGNVSSSPATLNIYIGDTRMTPTAITLQPGESLRKSFSGINNGPVKIVSDINIVAAERVIYKVGGTNTSFTEMMALPNSQLSNTYWLPWYNNVDLDTQLRIGNVSASPASIDIYLGNTLMTPTAIMLQPGQSIRKSFSGVNNGPVRIVSNVSIVAAERLIYKANGVNTSFSEMMALPNSQLSNTYWLPWYNNVDLGTQLRIGNVSGNTATIHILIGGNEVTPLSGLSLASGASTRLSYAGVNNGPVKIVSNVNIVAAERVIYKAAGGLDTSFSEMMALPNSQLSSTYWLPWYNNVDLDTQLRFGVP